MDTDECQWTVRRIHENYWEIVFVPEDSGHYEEGPPYDAATATGMYDAW